MYRKEWFMQPWTGYVSNMVQMIQTILYCFESDFYWSQTHFSVMEIVSGFSTWNRDIYIFFLLRIHSSSAVTFYFMCFTVQESLQTRVTLHISWQNVVQLKDFLVLLSMLGIGSFFLQTNYGILVWWEKLWSLSDGKLLQNYLLWACLLLGWRENHVLLCFYT